jgi:hypothetical protein
MVGTRTRKRVRLFDYFTDLIFSFSNVLSTFTASVTVSGSRIAIFKGRVDRGTRYNRMLLCNDQAHPHACLFAQHY